MLAILTAAAFGAVPAGCSNGTGGGNPDNGNGTAEVMETSSAQGTVTAEAKPSKEYSEMVKRSLLSLGNTYRLEKKLAQAASGEKTTVAYLGGSITEGGGGTPEMCYAKFSYKYIAENYGTGDNVEYVNAGLSGTPSVLGNLRVQKDVLDKNPDIVFLEFAVNDGMEQIFKESYESLVRTVLQQENEPAVILLFTVMEGGHTCQPHMSEIGEYYGLPMISVPNAIKPEIEAGNMTWADYSKDYAHPTIEGHKLVAEFIEYCFETIKSRNAMDAPMEIPVLPKFGSPYENAFLAEADYGNSNPDLQIVETGSFSVKAGRIADFEKGAWVYGGEGTESMKLTVRGNSLFLVCKRNKTDNMGKFDVCIDGARFASIDTYNKDSWGEPYAFQVIKRSGVHEMNVEIVPSEDSEGKTIEIFGIAYSANEDITF